MACVCAFAFASCGKGKAPQSSESSSESISFDKAEKTTVTIYVDASNTYGSYIKGSDESYVKDVIERKFYKDTGNAIDLNIMYQTHSTFSTVFGAVMSTGKWDAAVSYLGQAGLEETVLNQDVAMNLADILDMYGEHIQSNLGLEGMYATTLLDGQVIGIPSACKTKTKGILIRSDFMHRVGYTSEKGHSDNLGAVTDAADGKLKTLSTIDDFTDMMRRLKVQGICSMPLIGNSFDIEFTITAGACGTLGYQYKSVNYNTDGSVKEVVPGWISENYDKVLGYEYLWESEGLWEADNMTKSKEQRITDYSNGKGAVFCVDPNVLDLIDVARQVKSVDANAQFEVLYPLNGVDSSGKEIEGSGAYAEMSRTVDCLIVNKRSKNGGMIVKYLDWVNSSKENYELCAYGIKNEHWIDSGEGYYAYPEGKENKYITNPPYSGVFALLHNDEISYRLYDKYSAEEKSWINIVETSKTLKNPTDGMLLYNMPALVSTNFSTAENAFYLNCATKAWTATADPARTFPVYSASYRSQAPDYIQWLTEQYKLYKAMRSGN